MENETYIIELNGQKIGGSYNESKVQEMKKQWLEKGYKEEDIKITKKSILLG